MPVNIHAACVAFADSGVLLLGESGVGKSDLALRLIVNHGAELVADDRVDLQVLEQGITAQAPASLRGLLEVRGVGILRLPVRREVPLQLAVRLHKKTTAIERLPLPQTYEFEGRRIPLLNLCAFETSAPCKIVAALNFPLADV